MLMPREADPVLMWYSSKGRFTCVHGLSSCGLIDSGLGWFYSEEQQVSLIIPNKRSPCEAPALV